MTGASKGIGLGIAKIFAQAGCSLMLISRHQEELGPIAKNLEKKFGVKVAYCQADISKSNDIENAIKTTLDAFKKIDILVQNAGIYPEVSIESMTEQDWDNVLDINLKGTFFLIKSVLPVMKNQNYGKIVLISSITGARVGNPGLAHYGASKAGMNGFMRTAAIEFAKHNITVNAVEPGNIMTEGMEDQLGADYIEKQKSVIPMHELGTPEDIGFAALYLASDESRYVTGQSIVVDGGQLLPESALDMD